MTELRTLCPLRLLVTRLRYVAIKEFRSKKEAGSWESESKVASEASVLILDSDVRGDNAAFTVAHRR